MVKTDCAALEITHLIGKKWSIALLTDIRAKKFESFYGFSKKTGITPRMLSGELKELKKAGLVKKDAKEKYALTKKGEELCKLIDGIKEWGIKWEHLPKDCLSRTCSECKKFGAEKKTKSLKTT